MYGGLGEKAMEFTKHDYTYNSHNKGVYPEKFKTDKGLREFWDVTALS